MNYICIYIYIYIYIDIFIYLIIYHWVPLLRLGGVGILELWVLGGVQNIFDFKGGCSLRSVMVYFFGEGQFVLCPFSHFEIQDLKISEILSCGTLIFNIHIFRFKIHAGLLVVNDFNIESKFSCLRSSFFWPCSGHSKPTKPMKLLSFFIYLVSLGGLPNHTVSKARTFYINVKKHGRY